jgi:site-specific DNA-methyltransferase (adenine-specific)
MTQYQLHQGDCLPILQDIQDEQFDLVYLDPPFFSQKVQTLRTRDREKTYAFQDVWSSPSAYTDFLSPRLEQIKRVLKPSGALFFHCDRHAAHKVRMLLDRVFGEDNFQSEIIWHYKRWSNTKKGLLPTHQTIYYYTKSEDYKFYHIYESYSPSTNIDQILQKRARDALGKVVYARDSLGNTIGSSEKKGVPLGDVWDIPYLNPKATERTGYPTQKPILLLERIITLCTDEGDWVLDPFCGSGTTLVASMLLNRNTVGIEVSSEAIALTEKRLQEPTKTESPLLKRGRESYRQAYERLDELLDGVDFVPVQRNKGIDAILVEQVNGYPVLVRVQRETETLLESAQLLQKASKEKQPALLLVVATRDHTDMFTNDIETVFPNITIVKSPGLLIKQKLQDLQGFLWENAPISEASHESIR